MPTVTAIMITIVRARARSSSLTEGRVAPASDDGLRRALHVLGRRQAHGRDERSERDVRPEFDQRHVVVELARQENQGPRLTALFN